ncbi:serine/threonine-protein kinase [Cellulomonas cellasea]|uniref:serine/threonine-protein kinase n=1 Tax=Cellulomonas cellasea TaxID=43670 RepID=UPI0011448082|nr:serine/threonine-protein kinase [Cellulomonas cellasea]
MQRTQDEGASRVDPTRLDALVGHALGRRYRIDGTLGHGGMGTVFAATDVRLRRPVALKVFSLEGVPARDIGRYAGEARVLASLSHPGLVALLDVGADQGPEGEPLAYLVMELVDGVTLRERLDEGPIDPVEVADIGRQLAEALGHAHAAGVVHRDLKPANILLAHEPVLSGEAEAPATATKLADFGIAQALGGPTSGETSAGRTLGTASYLSPEQALGRPLGATSDVYSLGLVLLECLTGERAYPGEALSSSLARLLDAPEVPDSLGPTWCSLLQEMTASDPTMRPSTTEVAERLRRLRRPALWDRVAARLG